MNTVDSKRINHLIFQLREIQNGNLWMGDNFEQKLQSIDEKQAFERPIQDVHSVAEILIHLIAWNKDLIHKIIEGKGRLIGGDLKDWESLEDAKKRGWDNIVGEFEKSLSEITDLLKDKDDSFLEVIYQDQDYGRKFPFSFVLDGILHHHLYHLGQIGLIIKMINLRGK